VADAFDAPGNVPPLDPRTYTHEYGVPVLFLRWHSTEPGFCVDDADRDYVPAEVTAGGHVYAGGALRCRGASSLNFPKKSFTVKFAGADLFNGPAGAAQFTARKRIVLTQTFDDNSYLRTRLALWLWDVLDPEHLQLAQASAVVFVDGKYWGLYQLIDHVDDELIERNGLARSGNLYKSYNHEANLRITHGDGTPKEDLSIGYEKKEGEPATDFSDLFALLSWVSTSSDADFQRQLDQQLVSGDFVDWYVFATVILADDSYGKNAYLYHDPADPDGRWRYAPWDMNESFGQDWQSFRIPFDREGRFASWALEANGLWQRMSQIPPLATRVDERMKAALAGPMSMTAVLAQLGAMAAEVGPVARRDQRKWGAAYRAWSWWSSRSDFNDHDGEIA
jgi:hypothetical protein